MSDRLDRLEEMVASLRDGPMRQVSRLASAIERGGPDVEALLDVMYRRAGKSHVVGITGPPGAGKSSMVDRLIEAWRTTGNRVAVIAVDPSSPVSGGAALGDRYRMMRHHADASVFIRSMASRGLPGGLAPAALGLVQLFDVSGFDPILVETVGVGQSDTAITALSDTTVLVQNPGTGDSLQTLKAGILELGDILVVNKADRPGAREMARDLRGMLQLAPRGDGWARRVVLTSATDETGFADLVGAIDAHRLWLTNDQARRDRREERATGEIMTILQATLAGRTTGRTTSFRREVLQVANRASSPWRAVDVILGADRDQAP